MKMVKSLLPKTLMIFLIFSVVCGILYTGAVTGLAQLLFPDKANGSIIEVDGKKYGCELKMFWAVIIMFLTSAPRMLLFIFSLKVVEMLILYRLDIIYFPPQIIKKYNVMLF